MDSEEEIKPGNIVTVGGQDYGVVKSPTSSCRGCAGGDDQDVCKSLPVCSTISFGLVHYVKEVPACGA